MSTPQGKGVARTLRGGLAALVMAELPAQERPASREWLSMPEGRNNLEAI
jgi:hypothetical protein